MLQTIDPFYHPSAAQPDPAQPLPNQQQDTNAKGSGGGILKNLTALNIGAGKRGWYVSNQQGMWMGDNDFVNAPVSIDMNGRAIFRDEVGQTIIDPSGIKSDTQFLSSTIEDFTDRQTSKAIAIDVDYTQLAFTLSRVTNILIPISVSAYISGFTGGDAGKHPIGVVQLKVDKVIQKFMIEFHDTRMYSADVSLTVSRTFSESYQKLMQLTPGLHTIGLVMYFLVASSYVFHVTQSSVSYITLGR